MGTTYDTSHNKQHFCAPCNALAFMPLNGSFCKQISHTFRQRTIHFFVLRWPIVSDDNDYNKRQKIALL